MNAQQNNDSDTDDGNGRTIEPDWKTVLTNNGVVVLEGVAGTGKTFSITAAKETLRAWGGGPQICWAAYWEQIGKKLKDKCLEPALVVEALKSYPLKKLKAVASLFDTSCMKYVMHPSTSYEEFIGGLRPTGKKKIPFAWQQGTFLNFLDKAIANPCTPHLFVMDEINRCNLASVIGELMYLIEPSRRVRCTEKPDNYDEAKELFTECKAITIGPKVHERADGNKDFANIYWIPDNFFILGTMNSSDRSIIGFDQALRRRFPPYRIEPFDQSRFDRFGKRAFGKLAVAKNAKQRFLALNTMLRFLIGPDAMVGHSYLLDAFNSAKDANDLLQRINAAWQFGILPQVIHACETVRKPEIATSLCGRGICNPGSEAALAEARDETYKLLSDLANFDQDGTASTKRWEECRKQTGLIEKTDDIENQIKECIKHLTPVCEDGTRSHFIQSVGVDHGQRLLIVEDECNPIKANPGSGSGSGQRQEKAD